MNFKDFKKAGHAPSLLSAFLYFDVSFMIWVMCGALALFISSDLGLNDAQKATMVAIPVLGGALLRIPMGIIADRIGSRKTALIGMTITFVPLLWGWLGAGDIPSVYAFGLLLGIAGSSFGVALPLASRWYPPRYQGLAMGIAGAGNSGTALATFFAPRIAETMGWHAVFGLTMIPLALVYIAFFIMARDAPNRPEPKKISEYLSIFKIRDTWWFCLFYAITFGGFVGLSSYFGIVFYDVFGDKTVAGGISKVEVGYLVTVTVIAGSFVRPLGGYIADRIGGIKFLSGLFMVVALCGFAFAMLMTKSSFVLALIVASVMMAALGMGNGAVFQLVPQRFSKEIGVATGVVGAAGGLGGFLLTNSVLGPLKQLTATHVAGFFTVAAIVLTVAVVFVLVTRSWKKSWAADEAGVKF
jgi:NNP family nitrate/nitrite transporter-like MFS transporter